jgi:hypothetical protein
MASTTRSHYRDVAAVLRERLDEQSHNPQSRRVIATIARDLAQIYREDNPRFRGDLFYAAAGLDEIGRA